MWSEVVLLSALLVATTLVVGTPVTTGTIGRQEDVKIPDPVDLVKKVLTAVNFNLASKKLTTLPLRNRSLVAPIIGSLDLVDGEAGRLSTMVVRREADQHLQVTADDQGSRNYTFDVSLGLEQLVFNYNYRWRLFHLFPGSGSLAVDVVNNSARLRGWLSKSPDGSCRAELGDATATVLSYFEFALAPVGITHFIIENAIQVTANMFFEAKLQNIINDYIRDTISQESFQTSFSEILCESFVA